MPFHCSGLDYCQNLKKGFITYGFDQDILYLVRKTKRDLKIEEFESNISEQTLGGWSLLCWTPSSTFHIDVPCLSDSKYGNRAQDCLIHISFVENKTVEIPSKKSSISTTWKKIKKKKTRHACYLNASFIYHT